IVSCSTLYIVYDGFFFFFLLLRPPPISTLFPYTTLFRSADQQGAHVAHLAVVDHRERRLHPIEELDHRHQSWRDDPALQWDAIRSEEHTSELQSRGHLVCRLLLEKKKKKKNIHKNSNNTN